MITLQCSDPYYCLVFYRQRSTEEQLANPGFLLQSFLTDDLLQRNYPAMNHLVLLSCLIPSSTACVERIFSVMNTIVTKLRSSLSQASVDSIMRIVTEGQTSLTDVQLRKAVEKFKNPIVVST